MEKRKKNKKFIYRILSMILFCLFCAFTLVGCVGGGGSSTGDKPSGGNKPTTPTTPSKPLDELEVPKVPTSDDFLMGAIGVYEIDGDKKVFYDKYSEDFMSFNELKNRQFKSLATIIQKTLYDVYGGGVDTSVSLQFGKKNISYDLSSILSDVSYVKPNNAVCFIHAMSGCTLITEEVDDGNGGFTYNYEYQHNSGNAWLQSSITIDGLATELENKYKEVYGITGEITTLGFTEQYKTAVLEYIKESIIGTALYTSSASSKSIANVSNPTAEFVTNNKDAFQNYKGYGDVVPKLIESAFMATTEGLTLSAFVIDSKGISLYPKLTRTQYVFYDNIDDIQDDTTKVSADDFDVENIIDPSKYEGDLSNIQIEKGEKVPGTYLRKLKNIILIPKLSTAYKEEFKQTNFQLANLMMDMQTKTGSTIVSLSIAGVASGTEIANTDVKFSDGSYTIEIGGEVINSPKPADSPVTDDGKLKIDNEYYSSDSNAIEFKKEDLLNYNFVDAAMKNDALTSGVASLDELISKTFVSGVEDTNGDVTKNDTNKTHQFSSVYNRLFKVELNDDGTVTTTILLDTNLINIGFNYYSESGTKLTDIPETYLMKFSIDRKVETPELDNLLKGDN